MAFCSSCGQALSVPGAYCQGCGASQSASQPSVQGRLDSYAKVPWYRRNWFAIVCFFIFAPALLLVLLTGNVYYKKAGEARGYSKGARLFLILYCILAVAYVAKTLTVPSQQEGSSTPPAHAVAADDHAGAYTRRQYADGTPDNGSASITVSRTSKGGLEVTGTASAVGDSPAVGEIGGELTTRGSAYAYAKDGCAFDLAFDAQDVVIRNDNGMCGGLNVSFNGRYSRKQAGTPPEASQPTGTPAPEAPAAPEQTVASDDSDALSIKGLMLGSSRGSFDQFLSSVVKPETDKQDGFTQVVVSGTSDEIAQKLKQATTGNPDVDLGRTFACNPDLATGDAHAKGGSWVIIGNGADSSNQGLASIVQCSVVAHFDDNDELDWYRIGEKFADRIFGSKAMSTDEFYQALVNNYAIPTLDTKTEVTGNGATIPYGTAETASYESPNGWRIELRGKSLTVYRLAPMGKRFN